VGTTAQAAATGEPAATTAAPPRTQPNTAELNAEAAKNGYGKMFAVMGGGVEGLRACAAIEALLEVSAIDTLLSSFILPLQVWQPDLRMSTKMRKF
jgi:DNA polymerase-1